MENEAPTNTTQPVPKIKRTILIIVCLLLVGGIAAAVIVFLKNIAPKGTEPASTTAVSAEEVMGAIKTPGAITSLEGFSTQANAPDTFSVIYKADGRAYTASTPAKESVLFVATTPGPHADASAVKEEVTAFMAEKGYEKTENTGAATSNTLRYLTFKSPVGVCQLVHSQPPQETQTFAFYEIACVDNGAISNEYSSVEMLLSLYKKAANTPDFTSVSRSTTTEDNKAFSILHLNGENTKALLLFAAIGNDWEFIGDLSGSEGESNGKYSISAEMRSKINDARWGGFLQKHFQ